jgi:hypothetical protein
VVVHRCRRTFLFIPAVPRIPVVARCLGGRLILGGELGIRNRLESGEAVCLRMLAVGLFFRLPILAAGLFIRVGRLTPAGEPGIRNRLESGEGVRHRMLAVGLFFRQPS